MNRLLMAGERCLIPFHPLQQEVRERYSANTRSRTWVRRYMITRRDGRPPRYFSDEGLSHTTFMLCATALWNNNTCFSTLSRKELEKYMIIKVWKRRSQSHEVKGDYAVHSRLVHAVLHVIASSELECSESSIFGRQSFTRRILTATMLQMNVMATAETWIESWLGWTIWHIHLYRHFFLPIVRSTSNLDNIFLFQSYRWLHMPWNAINRGCISEDWKEYPSCCQDIQGQN
jgi:hypothetical protein